MLDQAAQESEEQPCRLANAILASAKHTDNLEVLPDINGNTAPPHDPRNQRKFQRKMVVVARSRCGTDRSQAGQSIRLGAQTLASPHAARQSVRLMIAVAALSTLDALGLVALVAARTIASPKTRIDPYAQRL
jgi:hypothetical protein